nr:hypothetical protein BaRGS_007235 [Batillaria attramentaria]
MNGKKTDAPNSFTAASKGQKNATEISLKVEPLRLRLMQAANFKETAENRHPGVKIEMDESNQQIVFRGPGHIAKKAQSDARRLLQSIKSGKATQLTDTQKTVLGTTQGAQYVAQILKYRGVVAVWDTGPQGDIVIHAFREDDVHGAAVLIHLAIVEDQRELPPQSRPVLQSTEWMEHIKSLYDKHPGTLTVLPSQDGRLVCVTGTADILNSAATEVFKFIHTNTLHSEAFRFSPSRQRFVTLFWPNKLADIQNSLKQHKVQITIDDDGSKLCVLGQSEGLVIARTRLEGLGEKILCHEERLTDRHQLKFLYSKNCRKHLDSLGRGCRCVISLEPESPGLLCDGDKTGQNVCNIDSSSSTPAEAGTSSPKPPPRARASDSPQTAAAGATSQVPPVPAKASARDRQSNIKLVIEQGEIAGVRADVIVNTTSTDLDLAKGAVSSSILKAGGSSLQEECQHKYPVGIKPGEIAHTKGHGLACKEVYHIALEAWSSGAEKTLSAVILECLERASRNCYKTIAFPALGTGGLGYPREKVARSMFMVLSQFQKDKPTSSLREVRVVLHESDRQSIQVFRQQEGQFSQDVSVQVITTSSSTQKPNTAEIKISITEGEIAREKVGVIVNSTSPELDLGRGSVSASILKVGGSSLQEECRQKYPSGIKAGEIAHTRGHGLACKEVYHLALTTWSSAASRTLSTVLFECLERASKNLYTSIAFPALGTGKLGYPCENVARTMFAVVAQFRQAMPTSPLREVRIVLYPNDRSAIKAFRAIESQSRSESVAATPESKDTSKEATPVSKEVGRQRTVSETSTSDRENAPPQRRVSFPAPEVTFEFRGLVLKILKGDITKEDVDLLVIRTNSHLTLTMDTAAGVLKNKYGPEWEQDLRKKVPELQKTGVAMAFTGGGMVLFVDCFRFSADLKKAYKSCLEKADSVCVKSVAIPPLGTRGLAGSDQKVTKAAKVFIKTLTKFCSDKQRSVKELRVVTGDLTLLRTFADVVRTKLEKKGIKFTCRENLAVAAHEDPSSPPLQQHDSLALKEASLFVFADDPRNIETAVNEFRELVKDRFIEKTMSDDKVMSLNDEQVARIRRAGKQNDVDVNVNRSAGCLTLRGDHSDVIDTIEEINGIFMAAHVEQQEEKAARTIAQIVQWYFLKGDTAAASQRKEYGLRENRVIEEAFQRRDKCVKFADANGVNCVIDFDAMKQYPEDDPTDVVSVIRRVKITDARHSASTRRPRKWTSKSTLEPVDVVELHPTESEYKDVHRNFLATLGNLDVKINSIKRIENTMLYEQYEAKKFHLERQNPGIENEKSLWHGTSADAITNINRYGFNRSYCGKNATRYGQGVYFAVKSVISTNPSFSPADVTGKRYIYQCKVLVGHSVKGTSDMRFLPKREGETLYDSACNDPDDPDTYLIFNDTQAYPEYLVTFTEQKSPASL